MKQKLLAVVLIVVMIAGTSGCGALIPGNTAGSSESEGNYPISTRLERVLRPTRGETGNNPGNPANGGLVCYAGDRTFFLDDNTLMVLEDGGYLPTAATRGPAVHMSVDLGTVYGGIPDDEGQRALGKKGTAFTGAFASLWSPGGAVGNAFSGKGWSYIVQDGVVYYIDANGIASRAADGSGRASRLFSGSAEYITLDSEYLYFTDAKKDFALYAISPTGGDAFRLTADKCAMPIIYPDGLYYINLSDSNRVTRMWITDGEIHTERVTQDGVVCFLIDDGWLYGADISGAPFGLELSSGRVVSMGSFTAINVYVTPDSVYFRVPDENSISGSGSYPGQTPDGNGGGNTQAPGSTPTPGTPQTPPGPSESAPPRGDALTPTQIYENSVDAVFIILTLDSRGNITGSGSGFFVSSTGIAVTNHHVVVDAPYALIITQDGREFDISGYYSYDINNDLAIIQVDGGGAGFPYLTIGGSDALKVGESVYAIGSPYGEQNTFSIGNVSRLVEMIEYDIYKISNLIQITAPFSPGSSGGALLNDIGEVVGITTAVHTMGANIGYAVPSSRVNLSGSESGRYLPLPVGRTNQTAPPGGGQSPTTGYAHAPSVPTFESVSDNALFLAGGFAIDLGFDLGESYSYDYLYLYSLETRHFVPDTDLYTSALVERGFIYQTAMEDYASRTVQTYFYKPDENLSVLHVYSRGDELLGVAIGRGNALEQLMSGEIASPGGTHAPDVYDRFFGIPVINSVIPGAVFIGEGFAFEFDIGDNDYIYSGDYVYIYYIPYLNFVDDMDYYDDILVMRGFEIQYMGYDEYDDVYAAHFYNRYENIDFVYVYIYEIEVLIIAIG